MPIQRTYNGPAINHTPDDATRPDNWTTLIQSASDFHVCNHYSHDDTRVIVMEAGGGSGDLLDTSNGVTLYARVNEWQTLDMDEADASELYDSARNEWPIIAHNGAYDFTSVCVAPDEISAAALQSILDTREAFDNYPVLDESHFSELEFTEFCKEFDWASTHLDDTLTPNHPLYIQATDYAMENFYGYSDPGYISEEHVRECWTEAGHTFTTEDD
jgi:hypothetical protein